jgi:hypothetical protein
MADIYVEVGPMGYNKDPKKVPTAYALKARKLMRDGAIKAVRKAPGFTPVKTGTPNGFAFDATLTSITLGKHQGRDSVTCAVNGVIATYPKRSILTRSVIGSTTIVGGHSRRDVEDCISLAGEGVTAQHVIPFLRKQKKP